MKKLLWLCFFLFAGTAFAKPSTADLQTNAVNKIREIPYKMVDAADVNIDSSLSLLLIQDNLDNVTDVKGTSLDGVRVKYERPAMSEMMGFSGILLVGLEFTDRKTKESFWSFAQYIDQDDLYSEKTQGDLLVAVDTGFTASARLSAWAVVYGHLLPDGQTIAVLDEKESKAKSLNDLFEKNIQSKTVDNQVGASIDLVDFIVRFRPTLGELMDEAVQ